MNAAEKIAEVLRAHEPHWNEYDCSGCEWNQAVHRNRRIGPDHADHQAAEVVEALGLAEEWLTRHESGGGGTHQTFEDARAFMDNFVPRPPGVEDPGSGRYVGIEHRHVTAWTEEAH